MFQLLTHMGSLPTMCVKDIDRVQVLEDEYLKNPQVDMPTSHVIHGGMYARTITLPAGCVLTGALIKIATMVMVSGDCIVYTGKDPIRLQGYHVIPASAGRKQAFVANEDTKITMIFPTKATTVEQAEQEFTDDYEKLMSRHCVNKVYIGDLI